MMALHRSILEAMSTSLRDVIRDHPQLRFPLAVVADLSSKIAQDIDGIVSARLEDIERLKALLVQGCKLAPCTLEAAIVQAVNVMPRTPEEFRISSLDATCDHLRGLLIDLHAHLELIPEAGAQDLAQQIWSFLAMDAQTKARSADRLW